jgi:hypothetical protein
VDTLIGLGDDLGEVRANLPPTSDELESRRNVVAAELAGVLARGGGFESRGAALEAMRAMFRAAGMKSKVADTLTDYERKRRATALKRRRSAAQAKRAASADRKPPSFRSS